ncbi:unnamed protein product [Prorocentrum cordatum]|uniref:Uncharacterized protein n=1 Tax=Prorocentrum cordatum TaxID=2364126 RepID=A0ABN9SM38_9DINO|nr:unnamed protein product [Polarella glacialis]
MAGEGADERPGHRCAQSRKLASEQARLSADGAIRRLSGQVYALQAELQSLHGCLEEVFGDAQLADRIFAHTPALRALLHGISPGREAVLRRNVALHADAKGCKVSTASPAALRSLQRSDRLEVRRKCAGHPHFQPNPPGRRCPSRARRPSATRGWSVASIEACEPQRCIEKVYRIRLGLPPKADLPRAQGR